MKKIIPFNLLLVFTFLLLLFSTAYGLEDPSPEPVSIQGTLPRASNDINLPLISCAAKELFTGTPQELLFTRDNIDDLDPLWNTGLRFESNSPYPTALQEYTKTGTLLFGSQVYVLSTTVGADAGYKEILAMPTNAHTLTLNLSQTLALPQGVLYNLQEFTTTDVAEHHLFYRDRNIVADIYSRGFTSATHVTYAAVQVTKSRQCGR